MTPKFPLDPSVFPFSLLGTGFRIRPSRWEPAAASCRLDSAGASRPKPVDGELVVIEPLFDDGLVAAADWLTAGENDGIEPGFGTGTGVTLTAARTCAAELASGALAAFEPGICDERLAPAAESCLPTDDSVMSVGI